MGEGSDTATIQSTPAAESVGKLALCLVIVGDAHFSSDTLPERGSVVIGRDPDCEVCIPDGNISRQHARVSVANAVTIEDLGSTNGTRVGGRALVRGETVEISPDDVITIGPLSLILQRRSFARKRPRRIWGHDYIEGRLEDECARGERYGTAFAFAHLELSPDPPAARVRNAFQSALRSVDVTGIYGPGQYEVLLVGADADTGQAIVARLRDELEELTETVAVGIACYPGDGTSPDDLAARARAHARGDDQPSGSYENDVVVVDDRMRELHDLARRVASDDISALLTGETGVGKEILAELIHRSSPRAAKPFVRLNTAALPEALLESELFGHTRGAFTGATHAKTGLIEAADGGTLFFDEIGEMPVATQVKLLRVIETRQVTPVGSVEVRSVDVRFVAATNRDLERQVDAGRFRADLYYRLNGICLVIPPLRERVSEIEPLARQFLRAACQRTHRDPQPELGPEALDLMLRYSWPGNIRELRNAMERAALLCTGPVITAQHLATDKMRTTLRDASASEWAGDTLPGGPSESSGDDSDEAAGEKERIRDALLRSGGNQRAAAKLLGISPRTMVNRLNKYGFPRPRKRRD